MSKQLEDYEVKYNEFWKEIIEKDGVVNIDQVKRELYDFAMMINEVSEVYCHVTNGAISKPNTSADVVIAIHNDIRTKDIEEAIAEEFEVQQEPKTSCHGCKYDDIEMGEEERKAHCLPCLEPVTLRKNYMATDDVSQAKP